VIVVKSIFDKVSDWKRRRENAAILKAVDQHADKGDHREIYDIFNVPLHGKDRFPPIMRSSLVKDTISLLAGKNGGVGMITHILIDEYLAHDSMHFNFDLEQDSSGRVRPATCEREGLEVILKQDEDLADWAFGELSCKAIRDKAAATILEIESPNMPNGLAVLRRFNCNVAGGLITVPSEDRPERGLLKSSVQGIYDLMGLYEKCDEKTEDGKRKNEWLDKKAVRNATRKLLRSLFDVDKLPENIKKTNPNTMEALHQALDDLDNSGMFAHKKYHPLFNGVLEELETRQCMDTHFKETFQKELSAEECDLS
jgi:hypothetical protein